MNDGSKQIKTIGDADKLVSGGGAEYPVQPVAVGTALEPKAEIDLINRELIQNNGSSDPTVGQKIAIEWGALTLPQIRRISYLLLAVSSAYAVGGFFGGLYHFDLPFVFIVELTAIGFFWMLLFYCCIRLSRGRRFIRANPEGITISNQWSAEMLNQLHRPWSDVSRVDTTHIFLADDFIVEFASGGYFSLALDELTKNENRMLFEALDRWVEPSKFTEAAMGLKEAALIESELPTYTQLWCKDLATRHGSTHFVPLPTNFNLSSPKLGQLRIVTELATGGLSAIYLAERLGTRQKFVVKEAVLPMNMNEDAKERVSVLFGREANILKNLNHPNIVKVHDYFVQNDRDYLVLEYVPGQNLRQLVASEGRLTTIRTLQLGLQIAKVLSYMHAQQPPVVHRDLTPENLLLKQDKQIMLIDFGAANEFIGSATGTVIGKKAYISPEQLRGRMQPQSDIYSLGGTLYFLATGSDPIPLSCSQLPDHVATDRISAKLSSIIEKCTHLELNDRFTDMESVCREVELALSSESAESRESHGVN